MGQRLTNEEFISRATNIHGDEYNFSEIEYKNNTTKVKVYDNKLEEYFFITPASILAGCGNKNRITSILNKKFSMGRDNFIEKAKKIHGDKYNYSKVDYINNKTKIEIICPEHGIFLQTPDKHLRGQGCPKCCKKNKNYTTKEFIEKARELHGNKYDYYKTKYGKNKKEKVIITCPKHGDFLITPDSHLSGCGCKYCTKGDVFNTNDFIKKSQTLHNNKFDYSKVIYIDAYTDVQIICPIHGVFKQRPVNHLKGCGCPECSKQFRILETKLYDAINNSLNDISVIHSYYNKNVLHGQELDIYIPEYKIGVEYQGMQHFQPVDFGGRGIEWAIAQFNDNKKRDKRKLDICIKNNIKLLYFSDCQNETFLGEKVYHDYTEIINKIKEIIKTEKENGKQ